MSRCNLSFLRVCLGGLSATHSPHSQSKLNRGQGWPIYISHWGFRSYSKTLCVRVPVILIEQRHDCSSLSICCINECKCCAQKMPCFNLVWHPGLNTPTFFDWHPRSRSFCLPTFFVLRQTSMLISILRDCVICVTVLVLNYSNAFSSY